VVAAFEAPRHVLANPWHDVPYPNAPKAKRVWTPEESDITDFISWLERKHPGWILPHLFLKVKLVSGCRTRDLCMVQTTELAENGLTLSAEATKNREARFVPLSEDLMQSLRNVAGPVWLWERSADESRTYRPNRMIQNKPIAYRPETWAYTISNLFREFNETRPGLPRLRPHDLRARAITRIVTKTQNVDATARAIGVTPRRHDIIWMPERHSMHRAS
jgi:integrase